MEKIKGQRSSKTWWVTGPDGIEVKVTGVTTAEDAMAQVPDSTSARPLRKFKTVTVIGDTTIVTTPTIPEGDTATPEGDTVTVPDGE